MDLKKIIRESIYKVLLQERLSSVLYHFTSVNNLLSIIKEDRFILSTSYSGSSDDWGGKKKFFISFTRQRNGKIGYSRTNMVRISFNGDLLNQRFSGKAIDYWGDSMGKQHYFRKRKEGELIDRFQSDTESEDRLFYDDPVIDNISKYITRVDIFWNPDRKWCSSNNALVMLQELFKYNDIKTKLNIYIYDNEDEFNKQSQNVINDKIREMVLSKDVTNDNSYLYETNKLSTYQLANLFLFMVECEGINKIDKIKEFIGKTLKQYGLNEFINAIIKETIELFHRYHNINDFQFDDVLSTVNNKECYIKIARLIRDWMNKNGFNDIRDAKKQHSKVNVLAYDFQREVKCLVMKSGYRKTIILEPKKTSFWAVFPNERHWFIDDILNNIEGHGSKSDEHFKKYLQHLVRNDIPLFKMLEILDKMKISSNTKASILSDAKFEYINVTYNDMYNYSFLNEKERERFEKLFIA